MNRAESSFKGVLRRSWGHLPMWVNILFLLTAGGLCQVFTLRWFTQDIFVWTIAIVFASVGLLAAWIDLATSSLPDVLTWSLALVVLFVVIGSGLLTGDWDRVVRAVLASASTAVAGLILAVTTSLGLGDVKIGISIGLALGFISWQAVLSGLFLGLVSGAVTALILLLAGRSLNSCLPLGPYLVFGVFACFLAC